MIFQPSRHTRAALSALMLAATLAAPAAAQNGRREREILPPGTVVPAKLDTPLSSKTSRPGDRFTATIRYGRDDAGLPEGTRVEGVVREAIPSAEGKPGVLDFDFRRMVFPDGTSAQLDAELSSLDAKSVKRTPSGRLIATGDKSKDRLKWVGIGAAGGLLVGALTRNNSLLSTIIGAGAGYIYNETASKKPGDVTLKEGSDFGIKLDRQLSFTPRAERPGYGRDDGRNDDRYYHRNDNDFRPGDRRPGDLPDVGVMIDDRNVGFSTERPVMRGDVVLVPIGPIARQGHFVYDYDAPSQMLTIRGGEVKVGMGSRIAVVKGERRRMDAAPEVRNGVVYVPMELLGYAVHGSTYWDAPSRTIVITTHDRDRDR